MWKSAPPKNCVTCIWLLQNHAQDDFLQGSSLFQKQPLVQLKQWIYVTMKSSPGPHSSTWLGFTQHKQRIFYDSMPRVSYLLSSMFFCKTICSQLPRFQTVPKVSTDHSNRPPPHKFPLKSQPTGVCRKVLWWWGTFNSRSQDPQEEGSPKSLSQNWFFIDR